MLSELFIVFFELNLARNTSCFTLLWALGPNDSLGALVLDFY